jgi:hypothetical protein
VLYRPALFIIKGAPYIHLFDTIEVIEAESHAMLKTLREHDFQDAFKK